MKTTSFLQILGIILCTVSFSACSKHTDKPKDDGVKTTETAKNDQTTAVENDSDATKTEVTSTETDSTDREKMADDINAAAMDENFLDEKEAQKVLADGQMEDEPNTNTNETQTADEDVCIDKNDKEVPCL